jgi:hypothetical protein
LKLLPYKGTIGIYSLHLRTFIINDIALSKQTSILIEKRLWLQILNHPNTIKIESKKLGYGFTFVLIGLLALVTGIIILSIEVITGAIVGIIIGFIIMSTSKITIPPNNTLEKQPIQTTATFNGIDQPYFNIVQDHGDKLFLFIQKLNDDPRLKEEVDNAVHFHSTGKPAEIPFPDLINMLITADLLKVYQQLGYRFGIDRKESFAIIYLFARIYGLQKITFSELPVAYDRISNSITDYLPLIEKINADNIKSDTLFILGAIINNMDNEIGKQYHLLLYRYASIIAKADGTITTKEADFLKSIMSPWNNEISKSELESNTATYVSTPEKQGGMEQLTQLTGLELVKNDVATLVNFIKIQKVRASKGMKAPSLSYHCVFIGNPGTGKTTVARILACIYKELGILEKGHLVETDRSGLVAEYVGQTAVKTNKIIDSAIGGVLFIDEAYSLVTNSSNDYGKEAIATLLKRMEDDRERLVVILAGYTQEMKEFIDSNPGLQSRFNRYIEFKDYSEEELLQIYLGNLKKYEYVITDGAIEKMKRVINKAIINKDHNFGNARWVRNIFEKTLEIQANRLATDGNISNESLTTITEDDIIEND